MAKRLAWKVENGAVINKEFEFLWHPGLSFSQYNKSVKSLHAVIRSTTNEHPFEVSTKASDFIGRDLSAFKLKYEGVVLENVYQASKVYEHGGPFLDLLASSPHGSKKDSRHSTSGSFRHYKLDGVVWETSKNSVFYDFIYIKSLLYGMKHNILSMQHMKSVMFHDYFTDIAFNHNKSLSCQARSIAIFKLILIESLSSVMDSKEAWLNFHKARVLG